MDYVSDLTGLVFQRNEMAAPSLTGGGSHGVPQKMVGYTGHLGGTAFGVAYWYFWLRSLFGTWWFENMVMSNGAFCFVRQRMPLIDLQTCIDTIKDKGKFSPVGRNKCEPSLQSGSLLDHHFLPRRRPSCQPVYLLCLSQTKPVPWMEMISHKLRVSFRAPLIHDLSSNKYSDSLPDIHPASVGQKSAHAIRPKFITLDSPQTYQVQSNQCPVQRRACRLLLDRRL